MARFGSLSGSYGNAEAQSVTLNPDLADRLVGYVWADDVGGNLLIEQSADGINWDLDTTIAAIADTGVVVSVDIVAPYVKATFTNGATPTTVRCSLRFSSAGPRA